MKPILKKDYGQTEEICGKCGEKVGYYHIFGSGENDWCYKEHKFCPNCGEIVDREKEDDEDDDD